MSVAKKILGILGLSFIAIGSVVFIAIKSAMQYSGFEAMSFIPLLFVIIGFFFVGFVLYSIHQENKIKRFGKRYSAKIYSYKENTSYTVNGEFTYNAVVHYFDEFQNEKEAILPTSFPKGSNTYPIGMTIDIFEYKGQYNFDQNSIRDEILPRETELMDDKPIDRAKIRMKAIQCQHCSASFNAIQGYTATCPYCGSHYNT